MGKGGICGKVVLDLGVHIKNIHKVLPDTQRFNDIIHCSSTYTSPSIPQYISKTNALIKKNIHLHLSSSELIPDGENADVGIDDSDISSSCDFNLPISLNSIDPNKFHQALHIFKRFSATSWGGLQSQKSIKADNYNILEIYNYVGHNFLFDASSLNDFLTKCINSGLAPTTILCKVRSYRRFIQCTEIKFPEIFPDSRTMCIMNTMLRGIEKTLAKQRFRRQAVIMETSRNTFKHSAQMLKLWREKRDEGDYLDVFYLHDCCEQAIFSEEVYINMRNLLITDLLLTNAQRPGAITGMKLKEVDAAVDDISSEGYYRIFISRHKTGFLQAATLFVSSDIFAVLSLFRRNILPNLPCYLRNCTLTKDSHLFQTFQGKMLESSQISLIVRKALDCLGIHYTGTVTDLRKAAATLTARFAPHIQDLVSDFLCHSRKVQDKFYRVQIGDPNFFQAFQAIEFSQKSSNSLEYSAISEISPEEFGPTTGYCHEESVCPTLVNENLNCSTIYSPSNSILHDESSISLCSSNRNIDEEISSLGSFDGTQTASILDNSIAYESGRKKSTPLRTNFILKDCTIDLYRDRSLVESEANTFSDSINSTIHRAHHKSIFRYRSDEMLFKETFYHFINHVKHRKGIKFTDVVKHGHDIVKFAPVISRLRERYPQGNVNRMIYNKVRTLGISNRTHIVHIQ